MHVSACRGWGGGGQRRGAISEQTGSVSAAALVPSTPGTLPPTDPTEPRPSFQTWLVEPDGAELPGPVQKHAAPVVILVPNQDQGRPPESGVKGPLILHTPPPVWGSSPWDRWRREWARRVDLGQGERGTTLNQGSVLIGGLLHQNMWRRGGREGGRCCYYGLLSFPRRREPALH